MPNVFLALSMLIRSKNQPPFQATKKEPVDGSRTHLALQITAGAEHSAPAVFINTKVFSESSESS
jgi:hypothetical protein